MDNVVETREITTEKTCTTGLEKKSEKSELSSLEGMGSQRFLRRYDRSPAFVSVAARL